MKRLLGLLTLAAFLLAVPASQLMGSQAPVPTIKAHVPLNKVQVCHKGEVITISKNALGAHLGRHGDCQLPACDFNNVFFTEQACAGVDGDGDDKCDLPNPRDGAAGTPGCAEDGSTF